MGRCPRGLYLPDLRTWQRLVHARIRHNLQRKIGEKNTSRRFFYVNYSTSRFLYKTNRRQKLKHSHSETIGNHHHGRKRNGFAFSIQNPLHMSVLYARLLFQPILCHILLGKELQNSSCNRIVDNHYLLQIMNEYLHNLVYIVKKIF